MRCSDISSLWLVGWIRGASRARCRQSRREHTGADYRRGMNPLLAGLVSGAMTATAALCGVWLTLRKTVRLAELQRADARREVARGLLVELVHEARGWSAEVAIAAVYLGPEGPGFIAWGTSEAGALAAKRNAAMRRGFVEVALRLAADDLSQAIRVAEVEADALAGALVGRGDVAFDVARTVFDAAIDDVADRGRALLSEPLITQA